MPLFKGWPANRKTSQAFLQAVLYLLALLPILLLPRASHAGQVALSWSAPASASQNPVVGYNVYYGTAPGSYPSVVSAGNSTTYTVVNLPVGIYYFAVTAVYGSGIESCYSNEVSRSVLPPMPSMSHYRYSYPIGGQSNCGICHIQTGTFTKGFGVRTSVGLCHSCHGAAGVGHERPYGGKTSHPLFVNVTADASHKKPSLGFVNGTGSDKTYTHLYKARKVVCMTCHNSKRKPSDPGRTWEYTTTTDNKTYRLQCGGWSYNAFLKPVVYRDTSLWEGPAYLRDAKQYVVPEGEYDLDVQNGAVVFHQAQSQGVYIFVTLLDEYLRNTNVSNQLCLDCHITGTHKQGDCTLCHGMHNTDNLYNIRQKIRTPQGALKAVFFTSTAAMSGSTGVCVVCHTKTKYHNATSVRPISHYNNRNCGDCHKHRLGFPNITAALGSLIRGLFDFVGCGTAYAAGPAVQPIQASFKWHPSPSAYAAGYKLYVGTESGLYQECIDVGLVTSYRYTADIPSADGIFYFAATVYDSEGNESAFSNEVVRDFRTAAAPLIYSLSVSRGIEGTPVTIFGIGFGARKGAVYVGTKKARVSQWSPGGDTITFISPKRLPYETYEVGVVSASRTNSSNAMPYQVMQAGIKGASASSGLAGDTVTLTGEYFGPRPKVFFGYTSNGVARRKPARLISCSVTDDLNSSAVFIVPKVGAGQYSVTVVNSQGISNGWNFEVR